MRILNTGFLVLFLLLAGGQAQAIDPKQSSGQNSRFDMNVQVWQDSALLAAPKLTIIENELSEFIVSDPDTVKISFRVVSSGDKHDEVMVESEIYLPQSGTWQPAATPRITARKGERASMEYALSGLGFTHRDGRQVEILRLQLLVDDLQ